MANQEEALRAQRLLNYVFDELNDLGDVLIATAFAATIYSSLLRSSDDPKKVKELFNKYVKSILNCIEYEN